MSTPAPWTSRLPAALPRRDGDPAWEALYAPAEAESPSEILRCAETLRIPWKRILLGEIEAEQRLRRYTANIETDFPFSSAITILSFALLRSWRVREVVESLACESREASDPGAARKLRKVFQRLIGKGDRDRFVLSQHLEFAYQRVLLLQRVRRAAARSRGTMADRLASVCSRARCGYNDAAWAIGEENSPRRGQGFEAAVQKVRDEGFLIPRAETEARALTELRRLIRALPHRARRRAAARADGPTRAATPPV